MEKFIIYSKEYRQRYVQFMKYLQTIGYSEGSCKTYATGVRDFLHWLEKQKATLTEVEESDIENFYTYLQLRPGVNTGTTLSESRIGSHMYAVTLFFQCQQALDELEVNPMNVAYPRAYRHTRENLISLQDIQQLYAECQTAKQQAILGLIYGCGLRREEAVKLDAKDIHFKNKMLYVREGKGGRKRCVPLGDKIATDLKNYYYEERPGELNRTHTDSMQAFMINKHGTRMQGYTYLNEIKKLLHQACLNERITIHHFRHAIATHLLESGMKLEHVKDFLGHKSIETTQIYTHITTAQIKKTTAYGITALPV